MNFIRKTTLFLILVFITFTVVKAQDPSGKPIRLAIAGLTHAHVGFFLGRKANPDSELVGVYEPNRELALSIAKRYRFDPKLIYSDLGKMLDEVKPDAVSAFGSIYEHEAALKACAPRGINLMVEKPLATNLLQAQRMQQLANKYHILLMTNYETSWYPTTAKSNQLVNDSNYVGAVRKVVFHHGHQGPIEIGCGKEFTDWLTDPIQNGGGALVDFGCYGANIMTYLNGGEQPLSVTAVARHYKPKVYPKVEDDATIIVNYSKSQCVIQASWNWPFNRKDMEIYGETGYVIAENNTDMRLRTSKTKSEIRRKISSNDVLVYQDPYTYFFGVIKGKIKMSKYDLYSLENNMMVVKILDAAKQSVKTGKTVYFAK